jgi:hypothetical protein
MAAGRLRIRSAHVRRPSADSAPYFRVPGASSMTKPITTTPRLGPRRAIRKALEYLHIALERMPEACGPAESSDGRKPPRKQRGIPHKRPPLTAGRLRELLDYAPETGLFLWRKPHGSVTAGHRAGTVGFGGYRVVSIDRRRYYCHRLAWLHMYGDHPRGRIDHINGDRSDDRITNLRDCSQRENMRNMRGHSSSGFKGVYPSKNSSRWQASIFVDNAIVRLGTFATKEEAAAAYDAAARRHFGAFARTNDRQ